MKAILLLMFALCGLLNSSIEYDEAEGQNPDNLWHRIKRWFHGLICNDEGGSHA